MLYWLACNNNDLTTLDVSKNTALWVLNCSGNRLTTLDVSSNSALNVLDCTNNHLTSLDLGSRNMNTVEVGKNSCLVTVGPDRTFDLTTLPGGFDVTKADNWIGGKVSGTTLTVDSGAKEVTYTYLCGTMHGTPSTHLFTLLIEELVPPASLPQTGDAESPGLWLALLALSASALALLLRRRAA